MNLSTHGVVTERFKKEYQTLQTSALPFDEDYWVYLVTGEDEPTVNVEQLHTYGLKLSRRLDKFLTYLEENTTED